MENYTKILETQLCLDYGCTAEELRGGENQFHPRVPCPGMRSAGRNSALKVASYRDALLVMADPELLDGCRALFAGKTGTWLSEPQSLRRVDDFLRASGHYLADAHHHYIPCPGFPAVQRRFDLRWYERDEIPRFQGDGRFYEALLFDPEVPDMLAVCAVEGETILGMASVTRNCESLWEIGVNVTDEGRGRGVGSYVTAVLKEEVLRRGVVPTYATVESHIRSQKVAFRAGFEPAFYEIFSGELSRL